MNRSFTKQRKIQEANMLLENRFLIKERREERDKDSNNWYTAQDPTSKKWKIFVQTFSPKQDKDPSKTPNDPLFKDYTKYWVEYSTEANADAALVNLMSDMKSGKKSESNVTTTETPAQTTTDATTVAPQSTEPQSTSNSSGEVNTYLTGILGLK
jgi:hypothetical protein